MNPQRRSEEEEEEQWSVMRLRPLHVVVSDWCGSSGIAVFVVFEGRPRHRGRANLRVLHPCEIGIERRGHWQ